MAISDPSINEISNQHVCSVYSSQASIQPMVMIEAEVYSVHVSQKHILCYKCHRHFVLYAVCSPEVNAS